jgi:hypothetical protein
MFTQVQRWMGRALGAFVRKYWKRVTSRSCSTLAASMRMVSLRPMAAAGAAHAAAAVKCRAKAVITSLACGAHAIQDKTLGIRKGYD